jgi:hypothetical protein
MISLHLRLSHLTSTRLKLSEFHSLLLSDHHDASSLTLVLNNSFYSNIIRFDSVIALVNIDDTNFNPQLLLDNDLVHDPLHVLLFQSVAITDPLKFHSLLLHERIKLIFLAQKRHSIEYQAVIEYKHRLHILTQFINSFDSHFYNLERVLLVDPPISPLNNTNIQSRFDHILRLRCSIPIHINAIYTEESNFISLSNTLDSDHSANIVIINESISLATIKRNDVYDKYLSFDSSNNSSSFIYHIAESDSFYKNLLHSKNKQIRSFEQRKNNDFYSHINRQLRLRSFHSNINSFNSHLDALEYLIHSFADINLVSS